MSNFLKADNWFFTGVKKILILIVLTAMFIICSAPVVTFGASFSALYYAINKNLKFDRGYSFQCFFSSWKGNFKQTTLATLIFLVISAILFGDAAVIKTFADQGKINEGYQMIFYVIMAILWLYATWVFAYIAVFENDLKSIFKNCLMLFFAELPTTLYTLVMLAFVAVVVYLIPVLVLIFPGVGVWLISYRMQKSFRKYMTDDQKEREDELNGFYMRK